MSAYAKLFRRHINTTHLSVLWWAINIALDAVPLVILFLLSFRFLCVCYKMSEFKIYPCDVIVLLTFQEFIQSSDPVFGVTFVGSLEPHECALDVRLWGHWPETQSRVVSDQTILELPLGFVLI